MTYMVSITSQGQLSLPAKVRRELGFSKTRQAIVSVEAGKVTIEPVKDLLELAGSLKTTKKPLSNQEIHRFAAEAAAKEYGRAKR